MSQTFAFRVHDIVRLKYGDSHLYMVKKIETKDNDLLPLDHSSYVVYQCVRNFDGTMIEAEEDALVLVHRFNSNYAVPYEDLMQSPIVLLMSHSQKKVAVPSEAVPSKKKKTMDEWLDLYNDYKKLFELFGDDKYKTEMKKVIIYMEKTSMLTDSVH